MVVSFGQRNMECIYSNPLRQMGWADAQAAIFGTRSMHLKAKYKLFFKQTWCAKGKIAWLCLLNWLKKKKKEEVIVIVIVYLKTAHSQHEVLWRMVVNRVVNGNDFSPQCLYRIHSLLLELIEYSCNVGAWKASRNHFFRTSYSSFRNVGNNIWFQWISV